jgi:hypothetical protein
MQQQRQGEVVSQLGLQQVLGMPLVNLWLGLLLPKEQQCGDFSSEPREIWLKSRPTLLKARIAPSQILHKTGI